jgi:hypothetical protein
MKKLILATLAMFITSPALAVTGVTGAVLAAYFGFDPGTWIVGSIGGAIAQVKTPPSSWKVSMANGFISVMLAGLGSETIAALMTFEKLPSPSIYFVAFVLAVAWPWLISLGKPLLEGLIQKWSPK